MGKTKEQIDAINLHRAELEQEPLPYEDAQPDLTKDADKKDELPDTEKKDDKPADVPLPAKLEITEDAVKEFLKSKGIEVNSFEDLKPKLSEDDLKAQAELREVKKLSYGLEKGIIKKAEYEGFIADMADPLKLVYNDFKADLLKDEPDLTEAEIEEAFEDEYHQKSDETSRTFKIGKKKIETLAEKLIRTKYGNVHSLDEKFNQFETEQTTQQQYAQKILTQAPIYKENIKTVMSELTKYTVNIGDKEEQKSYEYDYPKEVLTQVESYMTDSKFVESQIAKGTTKEEMKEVAETLLLKLTQNERTSKIAKDYASAELLRKNMGKKGILPTEERDLGGQTNINERQLAWQKELGVPNAVAN